MLLLQLHIPDELHVMEDDPKLLHSHAENLNSKLTVILKYNCYNDLQWQLG